MTAFKTTMLTSVIPRLLKLQRQSATKYIVPLSYSFIFGTRQYSSTYSDTDVEQFINENKRTVDSLYKLSINIKKIRQLKRWVLLKDVAFVEETADFLKGLGANEITVANILEQCPEAFLQDPAVIDTQRHLWSLICSSDEELVKIIEKFPESFFVHKCPDIQKANITYLKELGLNKKIICRLLASSPQIFCNSVEGNKEIISALEDIYLTIGGSKANFKTWLMKLLSQDPFVLLKPSSALKTNLNFIQSLGFDDTEVLKLLSKLKGFIFDLNCTTMENSILFTRTVFKCSDDDLRQMILKFPGVLYYSVPVLKDRLTCLVRGGASLDQVKQSPNVLELTTQIIEYRIKKIKLLGHEIRNQHLDILNGTKKDFEVSYGRLQVKKERPLFNPVAPLQVDE
ncbi:transcription termination factor 2, mitochondrial [Pelobates fuscus]|uniref:transcription termination factor 2, mitochondrial n=1 Tax=Pelobates fuscus TaxID=191477 RepID=UPI002FE49497